MSQDCARVLVRIYVGFSQRKSVTVSAQALSRANSTSNIRCFIQAKCLMGRTNKRSLDVDDDGMPGEGVLIASIVPIRLAIQGIGRNHYESLGIGRIF